MISTIPIARISAAYLIPTDALAPDGTLAWNSIIEALHLA